MARTWRKNADDYFDRSRSNVRSEGQYRKEKMRESAESSDEEDTQRSYKFKQKKTSSKQ